MKLLWINEGNKIGLGGGSVWIRGLCIGCWWALCIVVKPQIGGGFGLVWIHGL